MNCTTCRGGCLGTLPTLWGDAAGHMRLPSDSSAMTTASCSSLMAASPAGLPRKAANFCSCTLPLPSAAASRQARAGGNAMQSTSSTRSSWPLSKGASAAGSGLEGEHFLSKDFPLPRLNFFPPKNGLQKFCSSFWALFLHSRSHCSLVSESLSIAGRQTWRARQPSGGWRG